MRRYTVHVRGGRARHGPGRPEIVPAGLAPAGTASVGFAQPWSMTPAATTSGITTSGGMVPGGMASGIVAPGFVEPGIAASGVVRSDAAAGEAGPDGFGSAGRVPGEADHGTGDAPAGGSAVRDGAAEAVGSGRGVAGRPGRLPVLVPEGFSWGALLFGPLWLAAYGAWLAAVIDAALWVLAAALLPLAVPALLLLQGLLGQDVRRWSLRRRGAVLAGVVMAPGREAALVRLLDRRPELRGAGPRVRTGRR